VIAPDSDVLRELVARARLAPSVHNIQPTRWSMRDGGVLMLADPARKLPAADPAGHDVNISHGAALEGFAIALAARGLQIAGMRPHEILTPEGGLAPVAWFDIASGAAADPIAAGVEARATWRGRFASPDPGAAETLLRLREACPDMLLVDQPEAIAGIAALGDEAAFHFLCDGRHRAELLRWMRLSPRHRDFRRDGLNAPQMALGRIEAFGAGWALGPLFGLLKRAGLARMLADESPKTRSAPAIALFHRPVGEDLLATGRAFYRAWLGVAREGWSACPMSALSDWPETNDRLRALVGLPRDRRLVNVFRIGRAPADLASSRTRLPVDELIVPPTRR
jgi:nitroreductase